ncbi:MAG: acyl-CoA thioesterase [Balneolaceae bacterium]|nr:acyl-CoA thioesterase [Balneolaceae bacterium]MCH8547774.1 acyl-CoA thioesterase [Balneolaceae bacterium]
MSGKRSYSFDIDMAVRDYELDTQGVVNNSVYQNYLEHARHEFIKFAGLNFNELHREGTDAVVHKIELVYKRPLMADDEFVVKTFAEPSGNVRFLFHQDIYSKKDNELILKGKVTAVFMNNGRPIRPPEKVTKAIESLGS